MSNKVIISISNWDQSKAELRELAIKLDSDTDVSEADYHLGFSDAAQLFTELTPMRLSLLEALKKTGPISIKALAAHVDRNYSNVHRDIQKLMEHELVKKNEEQLVLVPWDEIEIHLSLRSAA